MKTSVAIGIVVALMVGGGAWYLLARDTAPTVPIIVNENGLVEVSLGQTISALGVTITPLEVLEDSRCPTDVVCIQAGRVRLRATLVSGLGTADQVFIIGEPITTEAEEVTLVAVEPAPVSTVAIKNADYRFTFKIQKRGMTYDRASSDLIRVSLPTPGAVTGKKFKIVGEARGVWFFEASFPIKVLAADGTTLAIGIAQAEDEWMTENFVPFSADITIPATYIGPATIVLQKDNPSGDPAHDASASFPITIEY